MKIRNIVFLNVIIFCLPIIITSVYKLIDNSIGPVVFLYSIIGGILIGFTWLNAIMKKWDKAMGSIIAVAIGVIGMILLINFFIFVTWIMGEMDYQLM